MKYMKVNFSLDDLNRLATVLGGDTAELSKQLNTPDQLLKGYEAEHKSVIKKEIKENNILRDYIKSNIEVLLNQK